MLSRLKKVKCLDFELISSIPCLILIICSNAYAAPHAAAGPDHVDYGAYTGGYGAFGWYTDHPVLLTGH